MKVITLEGVVGLDITPAEIRAQLQAAGDVELQVHSPGGFLHDGIALHNVIADHRRAGHHVTARLIGLAASAASYMVLAADTIRAAPNSVVMIHNPHVLTIGDHRALAKTANMLSAAAGLMADGYAARLGITPEAARALMDGETWWHGEEIAAAGFADQLEAPLETTEAPAGKEQAVARGRFAVSAMLDAIKAQPEPLDRLAALVSGPQAPANVAERAAAAERERIQAVRAQLIPGHEALIEQLAFDGKTTGPEAAAAVLAAERRLRDGYLASMASAPAPVSAALPPGEHPTQPPARSNPSAWNTFFADLKRRQQSA
jgi:ATP-dependent protease ClpP protease subunit